MKHLLLKLASAKGGRKALAWRIVAFALIIVAILIWPGAFEPLSRAFISMALIIVGAGILQHFDK